MKRAILMATACAAFAMSAFLFDPTLDAQTSADPAFEVASVKPNKTGDGRVMLGLQPGGRFNATNVPLRMLLRQAFNVQEFQIVGGPTGSAPTGSTSSPKHPKVSSSMPTRCGRCCESLLAERFKLVVSQRDARDADLRAHEGAR